MKKYFMLLIAAAFLVGCNTAVSEETIASSLPTSEASSLEVTSSLDPASSSAASSSNLTSSLTSSSSETGSSSATSESTTSSAANTATKTVTFRNGGFTSSTLDQANSQTQFVDWFNGSDNILNSISCSGYAQLNYIGNQNDSWRFSTLILGSQNSEGRITFNFGVQVASVKAVVQPYTKYISFTQTYNIDMSATFIIDTTETDLSLDANHTGDTENVTVNHSFDNVTSFSIANKEAGQRVFVHSLEITYLVG